MISGLYLKKMSAALAFAAIGLLIFFGINITLLLNGYLSGQALLGEQAKLAIQKQNAVDRQTEKLKKESYREIHQRLQARRLFDPIDRLDKIDSLNKAGQQTGIVQIDYDFRDPVSGQAHAEKQKPDLTHWKLSSLPVSIKLDLIHEEGLLNFITALQKESHPVVINSCEISRSIDELLIAQCEIEWHYFTQVRNGLNQ